MWNAVVLALNGTNDGFHFKLDLSGKEQKSGPNPVRITNL